MRLLTYASCAILTVLALSPIDCGATSRIGKADIRLRDGKPCFAIPANRGTRGGLPFSGIHLSEASSPAPGGPPMLWANQVLPHGRTVTLTADTCIGYGEALPSTRNEVVTDLQPYRIYAVFIQARPAGSSLRGYDAHFCLVPATGGMDIVRLSSAEAGSLQGALRCRPR